jgi:hypothetical protein
VALVWVRANTSTVHAKYGDRFQVDDAAPLAARMIDVGYWSVIPAQLLPIPDDVNTIGDVDAAFDTLRLDDTTAVHRAISVLAGLTDVGLSNALRDYAGARAEVAGIARVASRAPRTVLAAGTASYTLAAGDEGRVLTFSGLDTDAKTWVVPTDAAVPFPVGGWVDLYRAGPGANTISPASGVTVVAPDGNLTLRAQNSTARLLKMSTDGWLLLGDNNDAVAQAVAGASVDAVGNSLVKRAGDGAGVFFRVIVNDAGTPSAAAVTRRDYVDAQDAVFRRVPRTVLAAGTASHTLGLGDEGKLLTFSGGDTDAKTIVVPAEAAVNFPWGSWVDVYRSGAHTVTISPASGVTVVAPDGNLTLRAQNSTARLLKMSTDRWLLLGDNNDAVAQAVAAATASATANTLAKRASDGGVSFAAVSVSSAPSLAAHTTRKDYVDALGTSAATASTVARRDAAGRLAVVDPAAAADAATKGYVDSVHAQLQPAFLAGWAPWGDTVFAKLRLTIGRDGWVTVSGLCLYSGGTGATNAIISLTGDYVPKSYSGGEDRHIINGAISDSPRLFDVTPTALVLRGAAPAANQWCAINGRYPGARAVG